MDTNEFLLLWLGSIVR